VPLFSLTAAEAARKPTVVYNAADGSGRTYGAYVDSFATTRPAAPAAPAITTTTAGGSILGTTALSYVVTSVLNALESLPSAAATITTGAGSTNRVTLTLATVAGVNLYNVYGRTSGTEAFIMTVDTGVSTTVASDTGAITASGAKPSGAISTATVVLRIPNMPSIGAARGWPGRAIVAGPATSVGETGKYEYRRI